MSLFKTGKFDEAIKTYDLSLEINPNNANSYLCKGIRSYPFHF